MGRVGPITGNLKGGVGDLVRRSPGEALDLVTLWP